MSQTSVRFIMDSGCSSHMCADKFKFDTLNYHDEKVAIEVAEGNIGILEDV